MSKKIHHIIFMLGTALLVIGMPVSLFLLSVAQLIISLNWVLELGFREKFRRIRQSPGLWIFLLIYALHLIFLFNTSDFTYAFHDLKIKLPLLALPLIYGTTPSLSRKEFKIILQLFVGTVLVSSLISTYILLGFSGNDPIDSRYASLFISHIRFSLIVVLAIFTLVYFTLFEDYVKSKAERIIYFLAICWFFCFLILLRSFTGIIIFLMLAPITILWWAFRQKVKRVVYISIFAVLTLLVAMIIYGDRVYNRYNDRSVPELSELPSHTINGKPYSHSIKSDEFENGNLIWIYVSKKELEKEWNNISEYKFDGIDRKGQLLKITLVRYLASLNYTRDSAGIARLSPKDIKMIENGQTNYIFKNKFSIYPRIYELLWELEQYSKSGDPSGHSIAQRIEYLKTGWSIARNNFWWGVGTGDVKSAFEKQYIAENSKLKHKWRNRTHNQYLTFLIAFGIFGFLILIFALFSPSIIERKYKDYYFMMFFLIGLLSMLNEDTLETHVGVSFFAFFYSFLFFSIPIKEN